MLPVDEITADRVAPTHVPPFVAEGIVLIEQMVLAVVIDQAIRVVHPVSFRCKMKLGAKGLLIGWLDHGCSGLTVRLDLAELEIAPAGHRLGQLPDKLRATLPRTGGFSGSKSVVSTKKRIHPPDSGSCLLIRFIGGITAVIVSAAMASMPTSETPEDTPS